MHALQMVQKPTVADLKAKERAELEHLQKFEDEHFRLQRRVRCIQADRLSRETGVHPQFRRQDMLLRTLNKEYRDLVKDLKIAKSGIHKKNDRKMRSDIKNAVMIRNKIEQDCSAGESQMDEVGGLIKQNTKNILTLRKITAATMGQMDRRKNLSDFNLASMENKLGQAMLRFNKVQLENKNMRDDIADLLQDRALFNKNWNKMITLLSKGKKFLQDLFESTNLAYDQRDEWCVKLKSIQEKAKMDQAVQLQEMRDLQQALDNELKVYEFLWKKGTVRVVPHQDMKALEIKMRRDSECREQISALNKMLEEIYEETGCSDPDKIAENFTKTEHENFSIYKLLTEYCAANDVWTREYKILKRDIVDRKDFNDRYSNSWDDKINKLKEELAAQQEINEGLRSKFNSYSQCISNSMSEIKSIFDSVGGERDPFLSLLGDKGPSVWTLPMTFVEISEKVSEMLMTVYYYERGYHKKDQKSKLGIGTKSRLKKYTIYAELPENFEPLLVHEYVACDPCSTCIEARMFSQVKEHKDIPFDKRATIEAINMQTSDPAFVYSDRVHALTDCRLPKSRAILARRYV